MNKRQKELINQLSDIELVKQLYLTQGILFVISCGLFIFLFDSMTEFLSYIQLDLYEVVYYGIGSAAIVILIDGLLMKILPKEMYDDGGINEKVFRERPIWHIFLLSFIVACTEEFLFRGIIQSQFGFFIASITFALLHLRYLTKPVLLISVLLLSFYIGWIFEITENLLVTIVAHLLIDFVFGCIIRVQYMRGQPVSESFNEGGIIRDE
ncbi:CPBP family intramembrane glutamic endopeptidase [Bacillus solimangrovi]|uniref:CAAX protease n=1 Tax=Bacillus solimangrovi TaxID=1305675 RepID=A0A1E5LHE6_9BACI|nr:CPBP family intramembrane glutamic endopeptidase [Bacillus solimangrovi]OEH93503.1 CAAX protease [Bacillus solimangrovi]